MTAGTAYYRFGTSGMVFTKPVIIKMRHVASQEDIGTGGATLTYWLANEKAVWQRAEKLGEEAGVIVSQSLHFSDYMNGILATPESSQPA